MFCGGVYSESGCEHALGGEAELSGSDAPAAPVLAWLVSTLADRDLFFQDRVS